MSNEREKDVRGENGGECSRIWVVHSPIDFSLTLEEGCFVGYFHAAETGKDFCRFECYLWRFYLIEHGFIRASISLWEGWYSLIIWHLKTALLHLVIMAPYIVTWLSAAFSTRMACWMLDVGWLFMFLSINGLFSFVFSDYIFLFAFFVCMWFFCFHFFYLCI